MRMTINPSSSPMKNRFGILPGVVLVVSVFICGNKSSQAALAGSDNAADSVYNDGWTSGDDGGTGFNAWTIDGSGGLNQGVYIGSSIPGGSDINTGGESFAMYGHSGSYSGATRTFEGGQLASGQQFSFVLAVNFRNGNKGFYLRNSSGTPIWSFNVGTNSYQ